MSQTRPDRREQEAALPILLLVDNSPVNLGAVVESIEACGYAVQVEPGGEEAMRRIAEVTPDLILLDVMLPDMDGFDVCRRLKAEQHTRDIPVILMTSPGAAEDKVRGFEAGAADYITKPLQIDELRIRVNTHLKLRVLQRQMEEKNLKLQQEVEALKRGEYERKRLDAMLQFIAQGEWLRGGEAFLPALARYLGEALGVDYVVIDRLAADPSYAETVALYARGEIVPNMRYSLQHTPCENVMTGSLCCYSSGVQRQFPLDTLLVDMQAESYAGIPLLDAEGEVLGLIAVMDGKPIGDESRVTALLQLAAPSIAAELKRNHTESKLRASRTALNEAQRIAQVGSWELELASGKLVWSDEIYRIFEIDPQRFGASYEAFVEAIHPDDREAVNEAYTASLKNYTPYCIDYRLLFADGRIKHVRECCETHYGEDGEPLRSVGTLQDITERKQLEIELRQQADFQQSLLNAMNEVGMQLMVIEDGKITYVSNRKIAREFGYTDEELEGSTPLLDIIHPDDRARIMDYYVRRMVGDTSVPSSYELGLVTKNGERREYEASVSAVPGSSPLRIISVGKDISERKRAQQRMELLERALNQSSDAYFLMDKDLHFVDVSEAACRSLGYSRDELLGMMPSDIDPDFSREAIKKLMQENRSTPGVFESRHRTKDGRIFPVEISGTTFTMNGAVYSMTLVRDITARKLYEASLRQRIELEQRLSVLVNEAPGFFYTTRLHPDGRVSMPFVSARIKEMFGILPEAVAQNQAALFDLCHPEDKAIWIAARQESARSLSPLQCEFRSMHPEKGVRWMEMHSLPHREEDGSIVWQGFMQDITARKHMEEELKLKEYVLDHARVGAYLIDEQARFIYVNDEACRELGYSREELLAMTTMDIDAERSLDDSLEIRQKSITEGSYTFETVHVRRDGSHVPMEIWASMLQYQGRGLGVALAFNISERKQAEAALAAREAEFRSLAENSPDAIFRYDRDCRRIYVNRTVEQWTGMSRETLLGKSPVEFVPTPSVNAVKVQQAIQQVLDGGKPVELEMSFTTADGREISVLNAFVPEFGADGRVQSVLCMGRDMTRIQRMQEALAAREQEFRSLAESSPDYIIRYDLEQRIRYLNNGLCKLLGLSDMNEALGKRPMEIWPDGRFAQIDEAAAKAIASGEMQIIELVAPSESGELRYNHIYVIPEHDVAGRIVGTLAFGRDITAVRETERKLEQFVNNLPGIAYTFRLMPDGQMRFPFVSAGVREIYGIEPDAAMADMSAIHGLAHPEDRSRIEAAIALSMQTMQPYRVESRVCRPGQPERWLDVRSIPMREVDGSILWHGIMLDITERKQHEAELLKRAETERRLSTYLDNVPGFFVTLIFRPDGSVVMPFVSAGVEEMFGVHREEMQDDISAFVARTHPDDLEMTFQKSYESAEKLTPYHVEYRINHPEKGLRWIECRSMPQRTADGGTLWHGFYQDISERKRIEVALAARERDFRSLAANMPDNIARWDTEGRYLFVNPVHERTLGKSASELIGTLRPESHQHVRASLEQVVASKQAIHAVRQTVMVNGVEELHDVSLVPEFNETGEVVSVLGIGRNMTERYRMQEEILARERAFRRLVENLPDNIVRHDREGRPIYVCPRIVMGIGIAAAERMLGSTVRENMPDGSYEDYAQLLDAVLASGKVGEIEKLMPGPDGQLNHVHQIRMVPEYDENGAVVGVLSIGRDITERKQMENELRAQADFQRTLLDAINEVNLNLMMIEKGRVIYFSNKKLSREFGLREEEIEGGVPLLDYIHPDDRARVADMHRRRMDGEAVPNTHEFAMLTPRGERREYETFATVVPGTEPARTVVIHKDITERKRQENELRRREEEFRVLVENSPDVIVRYDRELRRIYINPAWEKANGMPIAEAWGKRPSELSAVVSASVQEFEAKLRRILECGEPDEIEFGGKDRAGNMKYFSLRVVPEYDRDGKVESLLTVANDITERKLADEKLKRAHEFTEKLLNAVPDPIFAKDRQHRWLLANDAFCKLLGKSRAELLGKSDYDFLPKEQADIFWEKDELVFSSGQDNINEETITDAQGHLIQIQTKKTLADGDTLLGIIRDLTQLISSNEMLDNAQKIALLGSWDWDVVGNRVAWSEMAYEIYTPDERPADPGFDEFKQAIHPDDLARVLAAVQSAFEHDTPFDLDHRVVSRSKGVRVVHAQGQVIRDANGKPVRMVGTVQDINERKQIELKLQENFSRISELNLYLEKNARDLEEQAVELEMSKEQLQQTEAWYRSILHSAPDGMLIVDSRGLIMQVNQQLEKMFGYDGGELPGSHIEVLIPKAVRAKHVGLRTEFASQGVKDRRMAGAANDLFGCRKDGSEFPVDVSLSRLPDLDGRIGAICAAVRDVTERQKMDMARASALAEALRLAQLRSTFLAQMSHELRTPLNGILGYAQNLLMGDRLTEKQVTGLRIIQHSGEHLLSLINGILDHAAIEAGKFELISDDIQFDAFLSTVIGIIRVRAEQKNIAFSCDADADLPAAVRGDAQRLRQVLLNLLANAIKFTDQGQVSFRVKYAAPSRIRFEVQDSGVGIKADQLEIIFLPFEQTGEVTRRAGGNGLGLAISRKLVQLMGGDIKVESQPGVGSTFWFEINMEIAQSASGNVNVTALMEQAMPSIGSLSGKLVAPPQAELDVLYGFAMRGSMRDVSQHANRLIELDECYRPFAAQLQQLSKSFQTKAILNLIKKYRDEKDEI